jgi:hypothetical protein
MVTVLELVGVLVAVAESDTDVVSVVVYVSE